MPPEYDALHEPHAALLRAALAELSPPGAGLAVDIGCGPGLKAAWLADALRPGGLALGLDIDRAAAASARQAGLAAVAGDAAALPLRAGCADLVWMVAALAQFARSAAALSEARRALSPGGALVVAAVQTLWVRARAWPPALAAAAVGVVGRGSEGRRWEAATAQRLCEPADGLGDELHAALAAAGFGPIALRAYLLDPPGLPPLAARLPLVAWPDLEPLLADRLTAAERAACMAAETSAEPEAVPMLLAAAARWRSVTVVDP